MIFASRAATDYAQTGTLPQQYVVWVRVKGKGKDRGRDKGKGKGKG